MGQQYGQHARQVLISEKDGYWFSDIAGLESMATKDLCKEVKMWFIERLLSSTVTM